MIYRAVAVVLLGAMALHRYMTVKAPPGAEPYLAAVRAAAQDVPRQIGPWVGQDVAVPVQATTVLKPNVMISRRYVNVETGQAAGLMLVHTPDAHHMVGHYPLRCYPARGWQTQEVTRRQWQVNDLHLDGTEYRFTLDEMGEASQAIVVANCLVRSGGRVLPDMEALTGSIIGAFDSSSGAAQLQVYFTADMSQPERDAAIKTLVAGYEPLLKAVLKDLGETRQ